MRYSEIINEDEYNEYNINIRSLKSLKTMLSYGEVRVPEYGRLEIYIDQKYSIHFPPNFIVHGDVKIYDANIQTISGDNLQIKGVLDLLTTTIKQLPDNLKIDKSLSLSGTPIRFLPKGLKVGGHLTLVNTNIAELPPDLEVGGNVRLSHHIKEIPDTIKIGGIFIQ